eukprot:11834699-Alexandrium_andersonii.AAC.1
MGGPPAAGAASAPPVADGDNPALRSGGGLTRLTRRCSAGTGAARATRPWERPGPPARGRWLSQLFSQPCIR